MSVKDYIYGPKFEVTEINQTYDELEHFFDLQAVVGNIHLTVDVREPVGWDEITHLIRRDQERHGFTSEIVASEVQLSFWCPDGMDFLYQRYQALGTDGEVLFRSGVYYEGEKIPEVIGKLDMNAMKENGNRLTVPLLRESINDIISSRNDTQLNFLEPLDLDGNPMPIISMVSALMHSQVISEKFEKSIAKPETAELVKPKDGDLWINFSTEEPKVNQIRVAYPMPLGISELDPVEAGRYFIKMEGGGRLNVKMSIRFRWWFQIIPRALAVGNKRLTSCTMTLYFMVKNTVGELKEYPIMAPMKGIPDQRQVKMTITGFYGDVIDTKPGDEVYLQAKFQFEHNANEVKSCECNATVETFSLEISADTSSTASTCRGAYIGDAMRHALYKITGVGGYLKTEFYSKRSSTQPQDGCGANRMLTSGSLISQTPINKAVLSMTWKNILDSVAAWDGAGIGWEFEGDAEIMRVEPMWYFYQDFLAATLTAPGDWEMEVAKDLIFNKITTGYEKYQDEENYQLAELHGEHEYQTPIRSNKQEFIRKSPIMASGVLIEQTRRKVWKEDSSDSSTYHDETFVIDLAILQSYEAEVEFAPPSPGIGRSFRDPTKTIIVKSMEYKFTVGQLVIIDSNHFGGGYRIRRVDILSTPGQGQTGWILITENGKFTYRISTVVSFRIDGVEAQAMTTEPFELVAGAKDPDSLYNLLLTPKRILIANSPWISGIGHKKMPNESIRPSRIRFNGDVITKLDASWFCRRGDEFRWTIREGDSVPMIQLGDAIAVPEWISFTHEMTYNQFRYLQSTYRGIDKDSSYGYIRVRTPRGEYIDGWPYEISYQKKTGKATFKLLRRWTPVQMPEGIDCSDFAYYDSMDWIDKYPGAWIERCVHFNFN